MIEQLGVEELYARVGFTDTGAEYALLSDPLLSKPTYRKEDYLPLEQRGVLGVFGVSEAGLLVGFAACIEGKMPHYDTTIAIVESIYVRQAYRRHGTGIRLIEACEDFARIRALKEIFFNVHHEELQALGVVLEHRSYTPRIHTYGRRL